MYYHCTLAMSIYSTLVTWRHHDRPFQMLVTNSMKPSQNRGSFSQRQIAPLKNRQIWNRKQYLKQKMRPASQGVLTCGEFRDWCETRGDIPPETEPDRAFVSSYSSSKDQLFAFVTTRRMLEQQRQWPTLHMDATYKVIIEGHPLVVVGYSDRQRHFSPSGAILHTYTYLCM